MCKVAPNRATFFCFLMKHFPVSCYITSENKQKHIMKESFLYYLWENRLITGTLKTTSGVPVEIVNPGFRNTNSGPDYLEAKIKIGRQLWAGHVEIHVRTSDWNRHGIGQSVHWQV